MLQIWQSILDCLEDTKRALSDLWGGHLRFFRQLVHFPAYFSMQYVLPMDNGLTNEQLHRTSQHQHALVACSCWAYPGLVFQGET